MKRAGVIICISLWLALALHPVQAAGLNYERLKAVVMAQMTAHKVPGIQVCVHQGPRPEPVCLALGVADLEREIPMERHTPVRAGSITKSFTAAGIVHLAAQGKIDLDAGVKTYVTMPEAFPDPTIRQLMTMSSGLRGYINDDEKDEIIDDMIETPSREYRPEELVRCGVKLTETLGPTAAGEFHYTNTNYILLGMVIERVSGRSYEAFVREEILEPFGLAHTVIAGEGIEISGMSRAYHFDMEDGTRQDFSGLNLSYVWSAGAVVSTASDLCRWIRLLGTGKTTPSSAGVTLEQGTPAGPGAAYTAGVINETDKIWHNGTVLGSHGEMCYLKSMDLAIAVLTNSSISGEDKDPVKEIINRIIEMAGGD